SCVTEIDGGRHCSGAVSDCRYLNYCTGHGTCLYNGTCKCDPPYIGVSCQDQPVMSCPDFTTCQNCQASTVGCVWCDLTVTNGENPCTHLADCIILHPSCDVA